MKNESTKRQGTAASTTPLMVRATEAASLIDVSAATWHRMVAAGKTPAPVKLSAGCVRWRLGDLHAWVAAGCPDRQTWEAQPKA